MKYELTNLDKVIDKTVTVYRIRALRDIPLYGVKAGDLGGFVQNDLCLEQNGDAWIANQAVVCGAGTHVSGDAYVGDSARVDKGSFIGGEARIANGARILNSQVIGESILITGKTLVENSKVNGNSIGIQDKAYLHNVHITEDAMNIYIGGYARLVNDEEALKIKGKNILIKDNASLLNCRVVSGSDIELTEDCRFEGGTSLEGKMLRASGIASVKGSVFIHDNVTLSDCVHVYRGTGEVMEMLFDVNLSGDLTGTADSFVEEVNL